MVSFSCLLDPLVYNDVFLVPLGKRPFENIVGKGENADNQHFLLFPQFFLPYQRKIAPFESQLNCCLQMLSVRKLSHSGIVVCKCFQLGNRVQNKERNE